MSDLTDAMRAEALRLADRATHYALAGHRTLAEDYRRAANGLLSAVSMVEIAASGAREAEAEASNCPRCQGNGKIVTDWDRYLNAHEGDKGDEAVAECPDCNGTGNKEA